MNTEVQAIIKNFEDTLSRQPWFGRAVYEILSEVKEENVSKRPNGTEHSMIELIWHMNTWAEFVLAHLENRTLEEIKSIEENDWRTIDSDQHSWKDGLESLKSIHKKILDILASKDDEFLNEKVRNRDFNFRYMLNGLIDHNIYHLGQVAYVSKMLNNIPS